MDRCFRVRHSCYCPFPGVCKYWSLVSSGHEHEDLKSRCLRRAILVDELLISSLWRRSRHYSTRQLTVRFSTRASRLEASAGGWLVVDFLPCLAIVRRFAKGADEGDENFFGALHKTRCWRRGVSFEESSGSKRRWFEKLALLSRQRFIGGVLSRCGSVHAAKWSGCTPCFSRLLRRCWRPSQSEIGKRLCGGQSVKTCSNEKEVYGSTRRASSGRGCSFLLHKRRTWFCPCVSVSSFCLWLSL